MSKQLFLARACLLLLLPHSLATSSLLKLLPPKVEPGQRHLMGLSASSNGLLVSERAVVEVGEDEDQLVVIPGDNLLLQCSGPVAKVRQCVWYSPGSRTSRCCFGDCGRRERRCRVEEGRQVRREVEAGLATCQLYLAGVREGEEGLQGKGWQCDLGYQGGQKRLVFTVAKAGIMEWVGKEGETGVRKLEGHEARLGCRVRGTAPLGTLSWVVGGSLINNTINPVTMWEEEQERGGTVFGIQQSLHLANLTPLAGTSVFCRYSQRDYTGTLVPRSVLEAVVIPQAPAVTRSTSSLPWLSWVTAGGLLLLIQLGLALACLLARCAPDRFAQPIETPL